MWIDQIKTRKLDHVLHLVLDILEPLGPLGAQVLYVLQPVSGLAGFSDMVGDIARALEEPDGIEQLRQQLEQDSP